MITKAEAKEIQDAFGPCSCMMETLSVDEVWEEAKSHATPREFIEISLQVEDVMNDRMANGAYLEEESGEERFKGKHAQVVCEGIEFLKAIKGRCDALMAQKRW